MPLEHPALTLNPNPHTNPNPHPNPTPHPHPHPLRGRTPRYTMFKHMDDDQSGRIAYSEFVNGLRSVLHLTKAEMPQP